MFQCIYLSIHNCITAPDSSYVASTLFLEGKLNKIVAIRYLSNQCRFSFGENLAFNTFFLGQLSHEKKTLRVWVNGRACRASATVLTSLEEPNQAFAVQPQCRCNNQHRLLLLNSSTRCSSSNESGHTPSTAAAAVSKPFAATIQ